jgi:formiminotetrahydrofolate cyclodeaminase
MANLQFSQDSTVPEFLAALASPTDPHGALAAAAVAGAMGASLLQMVAALPAGDDEEAALVSVGMALAHIQQDLLDSVETETAVKLFAACRLPHSIKSERLEREKAIQVALRASTEVPLEIMGLCVRALQHAKTVAGHSRRTTSADVTLAVALCEAAFNAARSTLEAKLPILTDASHAASLAEQVAILSQDAAAAISAARSLVTIPPT